MSELLLDPRRCASSADRYRLSSRARTCDGIDCVIAADDVTDARLATAGVQGEAQVESTG